MTLRILLATCVLVLAVPAAAAPVVVKRNMDVLANRNDFPGAGGAVNYSSCWVYVHGNGREFAALGVNTGTAIYEITNPSAPVLKGFIPGPTSVWREIKSYRNWIYVVSEESDSPLAGVQIIRMTNPDQPVLAATYRSDFVESHTVSIDTTRALLVCNGTKDAAGHELGLRLLSLANPEAPVQLARWPAGPGYVPHELYVHDSVPVGNRLYAAMLYSGMRVFDIANPAAPAEIVDWVYPGVFAHNSWPDSTGRWLYVTDEMTGEPLKIFDLVNPADPVYVNGITSNPHAIVHNAHVKGRELYLSSYTEGVRVLDLSDPAHPAEFAWMDPFAEPSGGYLGVWEVCPYLPSGNLIASDRHHGLFVLRPQRNYGIVEVQVQADDSAMTPTTCGLDGCSCLPSECTCPGHAHAVPPGPEGAIVRLVTLGDSLAAPPDGKVRFAPFPGIAPIKAGKFGYESANGVAFVQNGGLTTLPLTIVRRPSTTLDATLRAASDGVPIADGEVVLPGTPLHAHSDSTGAAGFASVPQDHYRIQVCAPGFAPIEFERDLGAAPTVIDIPLTPVLVRDRFEFPSGWTVNGTGDDATSGRWILVEPLGTGEPDPALVASGTSAARATACASAARPAATHCAPAPAASAPPRASARGIPGGPGLDHEGEETSAYPGEIQPEVDRTPGTGQKCWVTGQGTNPLAVREQDIDNGRTTLTSPRFDLSNLADPVIGWWRWFFTDINDYHDWLAVLVSADDGQTWVPADTLRGLHNHWVQDSVRVRDHVTPTAFMRVRFVAADLGEESVVEAALDEFSVWDAESPIVEVPPAAAEAIRLAGPWPNPSAGVVTLALELPVATTVEAAVYDLAGRRVRELYRERASAGRLVLDWNGNDAAGRPVPAGLYLVRVRTPEGAFERRIARLQ